MKSSLSFCSREPKLPLKTSSLPSLKQRYQRGDRQWRALLERRHRIATKGTAAVITFLTKAKTRDPLLTGAELYAQVGVEFPTARVIRPRVQRKEKKGGARGLIR